MNYGRLENKDHFLSLQIRFSQFSQFIDKNDCLRQTMKVYIDDLEADKVLYTQLITFDENFFERLIFKSSNSNKRQVKLIEIAKEMMPDIKPDNE